MIFLGKQGALASSPIYSIGLGTSLLYKINVAILYALHILWAQVGVWLRLWGFKGLAGIAQFGAGCLGGRIL